MIFLVITWITTQTSIGTFSKGLWCLSNYHIDVEIALLAFQNYIHWWVAQVYVTRALKYIFKTSNICDTSVSNKIVDHLNVIGDSLAGTAPTTSSPSTQHMDSMGEQSQLPEETRNSSVLRFGAAYNRGLTVYSVL